MNGAIGGVFFYALYNQILNSGITEEQSLDDKRAKAAKSLRRLGSTKQKGGTKRKIPDDAPTSEAKRPAKQQTELNNSVVITNLCPNVTFETLKALAKKSANIFLVEYNNGEDTATVSSGSKDAAVKFRRMHNR
ncbi:hypothetical protein K501DRAFT_26151 [Backusella circina FSU 941]|nr:hypothetical protein K501DRAFT_26151 [Backusella circina FSU 941]